jgi:cytochrome c553
MTVLVAVMVPARAQDTGSTASETVRRAVHLCDACHGGDGRSKEPVNPALAGQMPQYLQQQLKDFRLQSRSEANLSAYMWGVSALLDDATIQGLAEYYAARTPKPGQAGNPRLVAAGKRIYEQGIPARAVKACADCHGVAAEGEAGFPRLAGQHALYLARQLKLFKSSPLRRHGVLMKAESKSMSDAEIRAVAAFLQTR